MHIHIHKPESLVKFGVLLELFEWSHLALEETSAVLTTEYMVPKYGATIWLPKRCCQHLDIYQLSVPARASIKVDGKVYVLSMMQDN